MRNIFGSLVLHTLLHSQHEGSVGSTVQKVQCNAGAMLVQNQKLMFSRGIFACGQLCTTTAFSVSSAADECIVRITL